MLPKPKHLGPEYAAQFQDAAVVAAYPTRPPYPDGVFDVFSRLATAVPRTVLDAGCGTGDVARRLAPLVDRLDAVDISAGMIARGKTLPGGGAPNLRWIAAATEDAPLAPPYALITAGESLHWMAWPVVMRRFRDALAPGAYLAITERGEGYAPWRDDLLRLIARYSTNTDFQPYDLLAELESRGLFERAGVWVAEPYTFEQSITDYVESIHSRNGFSRDRMRPDDARAFDAAARDLLRSFAHDDVVRLEVFAWVVWGRPGARIP